MCRETHKVHETLVVLHIITTVKKSAKISLKIKPSLAHLICILIGPLSPLNTEGITIRWCGPILLVLLYSSFGFRKMNGEWCIFSPYICSLSSHYVYVCVCVRCTLKLSISYRHKWLRSKTLTWTFFAWMPSIISVMVVWLIFFSSRRCDELINTVCPWNEVRKTEIIRYMYTYLR